MKFMKKFFAVLLSVMMVFSLAACSGQNRGSSSSGSSAGESTMPESSPELKETSGESTDMDSSEAAAETASSVEADETDGGKTLVVYFSATGNTEAVAEYIAGATGGDLFELVPTEPYTSDDLDWTNRDSRVSREHDDEALRVVELENAVPDNWSEYNKVFIGFAGGIIGLN